jgi:hypothetical protein
VLEFQFADRALAVRHPIDGRADADRGLASRACSLGLQAVFGLVGLRRNERRDAERIKLAVDVFAGVALVGAELADPVAGPSRSGDERR